MPYGRNFARDLKCAVLGIKKTLSSIPGLSQVTEQGKSFKKLRMWFNNSWAKWALTHTSATFGSAIGCLIWRNELGAGSQESHANSQ
jgi:hypothetical protein